MGFSKPRVLEWGAIAFSGIPYEVVKKIFKFTISKEYVTGDTATSYVVHSPPQPEFFPHGHLSSPRIFLWQKINFL